MPFGNTHNQLKMNFTAEQEYPDLSKHNNHMAKVLSLEMYANLRDKQTPSGFTVDDVIQTGVDNPGKRPVFKLLQPALGCRQGGQTSKNLTCKFEFRGFLVCVLKWVCDVPKCNDSSCTTVSDQSHDVTHEWDCPSPEYHLQPTNVSQFYFVIPKLSQICHA